jgi:hypothetical protein
MRPNPSDPERTMSVAIVATRLRGGVTPAKAASNIIAATRWESRSPRLRRAASAIAVVRRRGRPLGSTCGLHFLPRACRFPLCSLNVEVDELAIGGFTNASHRLGQGEPKSPSPPTPGVNHAIVGACRNVKPPTGSEGTPWAMWCRRALPRRAEARRRGAALRATSRAGFRTRRVPFQLARPAGWARQREFLPPNRVAHIRPGFHARPPPSAQDDLTPPPLS